MLRTSATFRETTRFIAAGALLALSSVIPAGTAQAGEIPQAVKDACAGDYKKHCSKHAPDSSDARNCMAQAFSDLSDGCVSAILDSDLPDEQTAEAKSATDGKGHGGAPVGPGDVGAKSKDVAGKSDVAAAKVSARKSASKRVAQRRHGQHRRYADNARHSRATRSAHVRGHGTTKVARYINRGTRIANFYVAKYTQRAFAKVFR